MIFFLQLKVVLIYLLSLNYKDEFEIFLILSTYKQQKTNSAHCMSHEAVYTKICGVVFFVIHR